MSFLLNPYRFGGGASGPTAGDEIRRGSSASPSTSFDSTGSELPNHKLIIGVAIDAPTTITPPAVQAVNSTLISGTFEAPDDLRISMYEITPASGNNGTITFAAGADMGAAVYSVWSANGKTVQTASSDSNSNATVCTLDVNTTSGDLLIAYALAYGGTCSWSGLTEGFDETLASYMAHSGAVNTSATGGTPESLDVTRSITEVICAACVVLN